MNKDLKLLVLNKLLTETFAHDIKIDSNEWQISGISFKTLSQIKREEFLEELKKYISTWDNKLKLAYIEIDNGVYDCLIYQQDINNDEDTTNMILDELVEKNLANIARARKKDSMLNWLNKTNYIIDKKYYPPFYEKDYLEVLEKADFWAKIPEFPNYEINSSTGAVRHLGTNKLLNEIISAGGKTYFTLYNKVLYGDKPKMKAKAYLLAITFIPNLKIDEYNQVQYIKDKNIDKLTNLVWSNQSEATKKNWQNGMLKDRNLTDDEKEEIKNLVLSGSPYSYGKLSRKYKVHSFVISNLIKKLIAFKENERNENLQLS